MSPTPFAETLQFLASTLAADPLLALAATCAWLDPLWGEDDIDEPAYEQDGLQIALRVTRAAFPSLYVEAVQSLHDGQHPWQVEQSLTDAITAMGIPVMEATSLAYGIPLTGIGVDLTDSERDDIYRDYLPVLACFGLSADDEEARFDDRTLYMLAEQVGESLADCADPSLRAVGCLVEWLFSCSGNSLVDYSDDVLAEFVPLAWEADNIAFAVDLIAEADAHMAQVESGLAYLLHTPGLLEQLRHNIHRAYEHLEQVRKGEADAPNSGRLEWAVAGGGAV